MSSAMKTCWSWPAVVICLFATALITVSLHLILCPFLCLVSTKSLWIQSYRLTHQLQELSPASLLLLSPSCNLVQGLTQETYPLSHWSLLGFWSLCCKLEMLRNWANGVVRIQKRRGVKTFRALQLWVLELLSALTSSHSSTFAKPPSDSGLL